MYTPTRRSSVTDSSHRFTPSKRGQAALDAFALGYDVQLPDYSFALVPRSAASEQTLSSFTSSPRTAGCEQSLPRSASFVDSPRRDVNGSIQGPSQRNLRPDQPDRKRFAVARHVRSPRGEGVLYSSASDHTSQRPSPHLDPPANGTHTPRPSTSSHLPNTPQYVLTSPKQGQGFVNPTHQERVVAALASLYTPRSMSRGPLQPGYSRRHSVSHNHPSPSKQASRSFGQAPTDLQHPALSPADEFATPILPHGPPSVSHPHNHSTRNSPQTPMVPLSGATKLGRSLDQSVKTLLPSHLVADRPAQRLVPEGINETQHLRGRSGLSPRYMPRPLSDNENRDTYAAGQPILRPPIQHRSSVSGCQYSPVYQNTKLLDDKRLFVDTRVSDKIHTQHQYSSSDTSAYPRGHFHSHPPSQRHQFTPSLPISSLVPSHATPSPHSAASTYTIPSPRNDPNQLSHHASGQSRGPPPPSRTPSSSSRATPPFSVELEDEAFRVHPERAALSRMESLLLLSACRNEVEGRKSGAGGHGYNGFSVGGLGHLDGEDAFTVVPNRTRPPGGFGVRGSGDMREGLQAVSDASREFGFQAGAGSPNHQRTRIRQRSGSMHVLSPQRNGPPPHGSTQRAPFQSPHRQRLRSVSLTVQGLSPDAVKRLRVYETLKCRDEGREGSLRAMVGGVEQERQRAVRDTRAKKNEKLGSTSKMVLSPTNVPIPISPIEPPRPVEPLMLAVVNPIEISNSLLFTVPPSPAQVPLPASPAISPSSSLTFSSSQSQTELASVISPLVSSESFMKYRASQGIESPRPIRTRQNTSTGRIVPTFRVVSSPEKAERLVVGPLLDTLEPKSANVVEESQEVPGRGLDAPEEASARGLGPRNETLRVEPNIERILTPPPSFWSPPPLSAVVRTSAPLVLLPPINVRMSGVADPIARTSSAVLPIAARAMPISLQRPMSVPASNDILRVGVVEDARRAWSCEPPSGEVCAGKSFAGDWTQCMVIDLSDEEDEGEGVVEESDGEDEGGSPARLANGYSTLARNTGGSEGRTMGRIKNDGTGQGRADVGSGRGGAKYYMQKGGSNLGSGTAANAVEMVQNAIVKLALDNAGVNHPRRIQSLHNRPANIPARSAALIPNYSATHLHQPPVDPLQPYGSHQLRAAVNSYFDAPKHGSFRPTIHSHGNSFPRSNPALDSLRSGLELRAAASASAVEEAVRARSASPSLPNQDAHKLGMRALSGATLPPRLQRLQAMQAWTHPQLPVPHLDIPAFANRGPTSRPPIRQHAMSFPQPSPAPQHILPSQSRPLEPLPRVEEVASSSQTGPQPEAGSTPPETKVASRPCPGPSARPSHPPNIVVEKRPVPPGPTTAPLARPRGKNQKRRSAEASSPKTHPVAGTPAKQPSVISSPTISTASTVPTSSEKASTVGSPQQPSLAGSASAKPRSKAGYWKTLKAKKNASPKKQEAPTLPTAPPNPPPTNPLPTNPPPTNSPPTQDGPAQLPGKVPDGGAANGRANKKRKNYKKSKAAKPGTSTSAGQ